MDSSVKVCEKCGSEMWDNRPSKESGKYSPKSPDFKCKNKECNHAVWSGKDEKKGNGNGVVVGDVKDVKSYIKQKVSGIESIIKEIREKIEWL